QKATQLGVRFFEAQSGSGDSSLYVADNHGTVGRPNVRDGGGHKIANLLCRLGPASPPLPQARYELAVVQCDEANLGFRNLHLRLEGCDLGQKLGPRIHGKRATVRVRGNKSV